MNFVIFIRLKSFQVDIWICPTSTKRQQFFNFLFPTSLFPFKLRTLCYAHMNVARVFSSRDHYCVAAAGVALARVRVGQNMARLRSLAIY